MKTFFKFLQRNKLYTSIEVFGLSVALGFVVLLASYARTEYSVGRTRPAYDSIYALGYGESIGMTLGTGEKILNHLPAFTSWTRISCQLGAHVLVGDEYHQLRLWGQMPTSSSSCRCPSWRVIRHGHCGTVSRWCSPRVVPVGSSAPPMP